MRFLITAGPTREPIDVARYISNFSSGKMGYALAKYALKNKHKVTVISGPVNINYPKRVKLIKVKTALEMKKAVFKNIASSDCLIMAAAVSDYRPTKPIKGKLKKTRKTLQLKLTRNPDILKEISAKVRNKILVGFAVETPQDLITGALSKLKAKRLDYIVANSPVAFGSDKTDAVIMEKYSIIKRFKKVNKEKVAEFIIRLVQR